MYRPVCGVVVVFECICLLMHTLLVSVRGVRGEREGGGGRRFVNLPIHVITSNHKLYDTQHMYCICTISPEL